jgi:hypothetical protein
VDGREILHDLDAAAMAVHVAEAADVHENVEAELLARGEGAQQFVVGPRWRRPRSMISRRRASPAASIVLRS